jgi:hypothetical protein
MPTRRRQSKRRSPLTGEGGLLFLVDDGVHPLFSPGPGDPHYSIFEARAVWEEVRAQVWAHELRDLWPPQGAIAHDGITATTKACRPVGPYDGRIWSPETVRLAVEADTASVEAFRKAKPKAAATVDIELDDYLEDLRLLLSIAEQHGNQLDELGIPKAAANAWSDYEMRRAPA